MAVVKKTWKELTTNLSSVISALFTEASTLAGDVDTAFNTKYNTTLNSVSNALEMIRDDFLSPATTIWADMTIYMSSFKENDKRFIKVISDNLNKYLLFIKKMITDEGIKRDMIISRNYSNGTHSDGTDKNYFSETPQAELENFEDAIIRYASNLGKNNSSTDTRQNGSSGETTKSVNWDEQFKNLEFAFRNELVDYITRIPDMIYMNYCLDSRPFTEIRKEWYKHLKSLYNL